MTDISEKQLVNVSLPLMVADIEEAKEAKRLLQEIYNHHGIEGIRAMAECKEILKDMHDTYGVDGLKKMYASTKGGLAGAFTGMFRKK